MKSEYKLLFMSCVVLLRWFKHVQDDDAERLVFYEKCMSIIVIIITPNGDWNYGYTPTTHNTKVKVQNKQKCNIWKKNVWSIFFQFCGPNSDCCTD